MKYLLFPLLLFIPFKNYGQVKILFDASQAEAAGSADWVIDADQFNLGYSSGPARPGNGDESDAQRIPTPPQSSITASTPENYWTGGISAWGIDCVKQGYAVETLPYNGTITFGNASNPQDLSNYKVFIVCEPNIIFSEAEKIAILSFVKNGGGLFMISDHDVSDRNNDGWDSPHIWNDLMNNNTVETNPFGITFDYTDFSETTTKILNNPADSLLHGPMGNVTSVKWSSGTTMTLNQVSNPTCKGIIFKTVGSSATTAVMCAYAYYGSGKIVALGDSSPCDDATGDPNDNLFNGYFTDASGNHQRLLMNATIWLAANTTLSYSFTGNGNWDNASNWNNNLIPPAILPAGSAVLINPVAGGQCILNVAETISKGAAFTVMAGKNFLIQSNLILQ